MNQRLTTPKGHNMFDISSLVQKAIRRGDLMYALYASNEMAVSYRGYLWKRLLVTSAEDCFDPLTHLIVKLKEKDDNNATKNNAEYIYQAVYILVNARKNRDADYFACNILNSKDFIPFVDGFSGLLTKNGHDLFVMKDEFKKAIYNNDNITGYTANEIRCWYRSFFWDLILNIASNNGYIKLQKEFIALKNIDLAQDLKKSTSIYIAKARVLLMKSIRLNNEGLFYEYDIPNVDLSTCCSENRLKLPEYVYDCHTYIGKAKGRTKEDFIVSEQNSLHPFINGWYDNSSWDRYLSRTKTGFGNDFNTPIEYKKKINIVSVNGYQQTLF